MTPAADDLAFDAIEIGQIFEIARAFTAEDVDAFAALSGDHSPLHVDEDYAAGTEFGRRVIHGMLTASLFSTLVGMRIPGRPALYLGQELAFRNPAFIGDLLTARAKVAGKTAATATLALAMEVRGPDGRVVVSGPGRVKLRGAAVAAVAAAAPAEGRPVAIVTGGVRGLGAEIAHELARDGYAILAVYRANHDAARRFEAALAQSSGAGATVAADLTQPGSADDVLAAARALGPVRVLVNAAIGPLEPTPAVDLDWASFAAHLDTQVRAVLALSQAVFPAMRDAGGGAIVNVLSQVVDGNPPTGMADYTTAKYALMGLSRALAVEWARDRIRVNMVSPGLARTELTQHYADRAFKAEAMRTPLGRLVEPADVARAVAFLAGDGASFVTGTNLSLSGGQVMR